jgi:hypothetical protein
MRSTMIAVGAVLAIGVAPQFASAYTHSNRAGGSTSHAYGEGTEHTNAYGGSTEHAWGGGTEHTNMYGGSTEGRYGEGASHTTPYGATAYAEPAAYAYHPPATVNYYGAGCYNCGGYATAGAVAAGVAVGAVAASAADASEQQAATTNAYAAGVAAGSEQTAAAMSATYVVGNVYPTLPSGCVNPTVQGTTYYLCGNTWFKPSFGANGVYYTVVTAP